MKRAVLFSSLLVLAAACGPSTPDVASDAGGDGAACMREDPTCPASVPSYTNEVSSILTNACVTCHYPYSPYAESSLATYPKVQLVYGSALGQVESCLMPPPGSPPLDAHDRQALLDWLACGAPDN